MYAILDNSSKSQKIVSINVKSSISIKSKLSIYELIGTIVKLFNIPE